MNLFAVNSIYWSSFLVLWALLCKTEGNSSLNCNAVDPDETICEDSSGNQTCEVDQSLKENITCLFYPTDILNCSWSFPTLRKDTQLSVSISICNYSNAIHSWNHSNEEKVGSWSWSLHEPLPSHVIIQFNMSLPSNWISYTNAQDTNMIVVQPAPPNLSLSVKNKSLLVTWGLADSRTQIASCLEYELDLGDKKRIENLKDQLSYEVQYNPTHTYRVRIRARTTAHCHGSPLWSDWSPTITVEQADSKLNVLVIISISLGIPMILLALLLLVRYQRVSKLLFPPIPRPPPKYIYFLEKSDAPSFFYPAQATRAEEEITEVEDTE